MKQAFPKPGNGKMRKSPKTPQDAKKSAVLTKTQRSKVFNRFDGCCAYCGEEIDSSDFQADHKIPKKKFANIKDADFLDNLMPSCRSCNIRKGTLSIERFRSELSRDILQLKRDSPKFRLLIKYGMISINESPIVFYFEMYKKGKRN